MSIDNLADHEALAEALMDPNRWPEGGSDRERIDTHISTVILAGQQAIKFKKPIDLGFLNFVDLDARRRFCNEELRLNRRLAPDIYLAVIPISGSLAAPKPGGDGPPIDWAVQMRRFDPRALLSDPLQPLSTDLIDELAAQIARFHQHAEIARDARFGTPEQVRAAIQGNFDHLQQYDQFREQLKPLENWARQALATLLPLMQQRHTDGHIRECHGDLHLGNIALINNKPTIFDAIEFNPAFRWIDTISDLAFLIMDLHHRERSDLAHRLLDGYLQAIGDYAGLPLLRFYLVYRAIVRAKVAAIRLSQPEVSTKQQQELSDQVRGYLGLSHQLSATELRGIVITHGVSGSGKSYATRELLAHLPAVRVRSDIERKRLLGLSPHQAATAEDGYNQAVNQATYQRLETIAGLVDDAGLLALIDATFLRKTDRDRFRQLAEARDIPFVIIDCEAPTETLRQRIEGRAGRPGNVSDADLEVMRMQQQNHDPLTPQERAHCIAKPLEGPVPASTLRESLQD